MKREIILTADGSHTIYVPEINEHYHSVNGAIQESQHIFIKSGFDTCDADPVNIFEAGFGTGLNALLTALRCTQGKRRVFYTSIEKHPLEESEIKALNYEMFTGAEGKEIFRRIHETKWDSVTEITGYFTLLKVRGDLLSDNISGIYELIYFDAFGPDKQPEIWSREVLGKISGVNPENGIFVTYSSKGEVKRNLRELGYKVTLIPGPPGKRHIIRAVKY